MLWSIATTFTNKRPDLGILCRTTVFTDVTALIGIWLDDLVGCKHFRGDMLSNRQGCWATIHMKDIMPVSLPSYLSLISNISVTLDLSGLGRYQIIVCYSIRNQYSPPGIFQHVRKWTCLKSEHSYLQD